MGEALVLAVALVLSGDSDLLEIVLLSIGVSLTATIVYPYWRIVYLFFSLTLIGIVFAFLQFTTFGMVVRAGMQDRETVGPYMSKPIIALLLLE